MSRRSSSPFSKPLKIMPIDIHLRMMSIVCILSLLSLNYVCPPSSSSTHVRGGCSVEDMAGGARHGGTYLSILGLQCFQHYWSRMWYSCFEIHQLPCSGIVLQMTISKSIKYLLFVTFFISIAVICGTDNILQNISHIQVE